MLEGWPQPHAQHWVHAACGCMRPALRVMGQPLAVFAPQGWCVCRGPAASLRGCSSSCCCVVHIACGREQHGSPSPCVLWWVHPQGRRLGVTGGTLMCPSAASQVTRCPCPALHLVNGYFRVCVDSWCVCYVVWAPACCVERAPCCMCVQHAALHVLPVRVDKQTRAWDWCVARCSLWCGLLFVARAHAACAVCTDPPSMCAPMLCFGGITGWNIACVHVVGCSCGLLRAGGCTMWPLRRSVCRAVGGCGWVAALCTCIRHAQQLTRCCSG
jgi:hypothetical protein